MVRNELSLLEIHEHVTQKCENGTARTNVTSLVQNIQLVIARS